MNGEGILQMKLPFFKKLSTKLLFIPWVITLALFIAGGVGLYFFYSSFLRDFHSAQLMSKTSEKKLSIDAWFRGHFNELEGLSRVAAIKSNAEMLSREIISLYYTDLTTNVQPDISKADARPTASAQSGADTKKAIYDAQLTISRMLEEKASGGVYNILAILSKEGRVLASNKQELVGEDWSVKGFYNEIMPELKSATLVSFPKENAVSIEFFTPILDAQGAISAVVYANSDRRNLNELLQLQSNPYKTEKIELIDRNGNVVVSGESTKEKGIKYNIPKSTSGNAVGYKDGLLFYVANLDQLPFRLIDTVKRSEIAKPYTMFIIFYGAFGGVLIFVFLTQYLLLGPKLITRPVKKLTQITHAVSVGDFNVDLDKGYNGEFGQLRDSFSSMVAVLSTKVVDAQEKTAAREQKRLRSSFLSGMSFELSAPVAWIVSGSKMLLNRKERLSEMDRKTLEEMRDTAEGLSRYTDELLELSHLEAGIITPHAAEFKAGDLTGGIEDAAKEIIGTKNIELVVDCEDELLPQLLITDRDMLQRTIMNLLKNAIRLTEQGTVTVLASKMMLNAQPALEVSVADTGKGIDPGVLQRTLEQFPSSPAFIGLAIAKKHTELLGGSLGVENTVGKGSVFTVVIPFTMQLSS